MATPARGIPWHAAAGLAMIDVLQEEDLPGRRGALVQAAAFERGLLTRTPGDTVVLAPPFVCTTQDIQDMVARLADAIQATSLTEETHT